jgi:RNA polymerase sigma factor (sigma-70 family)
MTPRSLLAPARLAGRPVLRSQSDERLVDLVRAGSEPAFEAIVARYRGPLLRYCRRILPDTRAEDAVQQTFVNAFAALHRDDAHIDLRPWLYRIAHNTALNALRDRALAHAELDEQIDGVERPDQAVERSHGLREVISAVQALPERQRDAVVLRELEGRSYEEIAGELGVSGGAVRQLLNRARTTLRAGLTAITPTPLLIRLGSEEGEPTAARISELVGAGGAGALATKVAATALVTGAVAGGVVTVEDNGGNRAKADEEPATTSDGASAKQAAATTGSSGSAAGEREDNDTSGRAGDDEDDDSSGGRERGDDADADDSSGPGPGGDDDHSGSNSGPGSGDDSDDDHSGSNSGPGSGDAEDDASGSGSGSGSGGSGSSGTGSGDGGSSGSGSGGSGSGFGGSGSESGSGSSGSGSDSSGSGSSGPGSGDDPDDD